MSDRTPTSGGTGLRMEHVLIPVVILVLIVVYLFLGSARQTGLRNSVVGFEGLRYLLAENDVEAQSFTGGWQLDSDSIGMLVIPLFDSNLTSPRERPTTSEDYLLQHTEYDLSRTELLEKIEQVPTLLILPKWRSGFRVTEVGHPIFLLEQQRTASLARQINGLGLAIGYASEAYETHSYQATDGSSLEALLYLGQTFRSEECNPIIGTSSAMVLGICEITGQQFGKVTSVYVLSDPDMLNNHGLQLGDNAEAALSFLSEMSDGKSVVIDYSSDNWLRTESNVVVRDRTWADLQRFFDPPFTTLWIGGLLTLVLFMWHASVRSGPLLRRYTVGNDSKFAALDASARLMRLADQDGALLADYATARLATVSAQIIGPSWGNNPVTQDMLIRVLANRSPDTAAELQRQLEIIHTLPSRLSAKDATAYVEEFEQLLERIANDT